MNILHDLSLGQPPELLNVFIEIPKGSKNKYELDKDTGLLTLDRVFYGSQIYPLDYGLLPQTHWHDGDPLDALILSTETFVPGTVVPARPIAVIRMIDDGDKDEKLVCVPVSDPRFAEFKDVNDIAPHTLKELQEFFETYKKLENKKVTIAGIDGHAEAVKVVAEAQQLYQTEFGK